MVSWFLGFKIVLVLSRLKNIRSRLVHTEMETVQMQLRIARGEDLMAAEALWLGWLIHHCLA